jgi:signal transduction histidine kinase
LLSILFENAVKYTRDGGDISITLKRSGNDIIITQKNDTDSELTGDPNRLFDRFYRSDKARTQNNGGIGIGLSVARALAIQLGGSIHARYLSDHEIMFTIRVRGSK